MVKPRVSAQEKRTLNGKSIFKGSQKDILLRSVTADYTPVLKSFERGTVGSSSPFSLLG